MTARRSRFPLPSATQGGAWICLFRRARKPGPRPQSTLRIRAIVIPPAWTDVCIADDPRAHIQAVGRDADGRLQYRYHEDWTGVRDSLKAERLLRFGAALPKIRTRIDRDLARKKAGPPLCRGGSRPADRSRAPAFRALRRRRGRPRRRDPSQERCPAQRHARLSEFHRQERQADRDDSTTRSSSSGCAS